MINVEDFGTSLKIDGIPEQIAMELTVAARGVREIFCENLGEEQGNEFFESILDIAKKTDAEVSEEAERLMRKNPELVEEIEHSPVMQELMKCLGEA